jgi:hypothetical protein
LLRIWKAISAAVVEVAPIQSQPLASGSQRLARPFVVEPGAARHGRRLAGAAQATPLTFSCGSL